MILTVIKIILVCVAVLAVLYMLAIMPRIFNRPDTTLFKKRYFAHRGLHDNASDAPENSMAAFRKAVEAGLGMELDVQVTKDGVPVVFHDFKLERICGAPGKIADSTYEELQAYTLCDSKERIPRFSELLEMVDGQVPLIVEIKAETANVSCCGIIDSLLRAYRGPYCIESFNPMVLWWFRRNHGDVVRGQLSSNFRREGEYWNILYFAMTHLLFNFLTKPDFIAYNHKFSEEPGRRICRRLYRHPAAAWTIRSQQDLEALKGEYDVFIFDSFLPVKMGRL
ncbi:MAG: glycerophosphodiester phosphodiesterase [Lachnospiraceae bacterium]|nr:glycerophosphodiester phosphodiesterase [Lachnospiraceae bacterium]